MTVTLFVPVLNELEGMKEFLAKAPLHLFCQVLVCDGGSTDGSAEWARAQGFDVIVQKRRGLRLAYTESWPKIRGDYVLTFSPDGNCVPGDMENLIAKAEAGFDMVIASRYFNGATSGDDDLVTRFGNWMFTALTNFFFGGRYSDVMNIFRCYRTRLFYDLDLDKDVSHWEERLFFTVVGLEPLLSIRAAKRKLRIAEIPTYEPPRKYGTRKLQIFRWGGAHFLQLFSELCFWG